MAGDGAVAWYASKDLKRAAPVKVTEFSRKYFEEQDKVAGFIRDRCTIASDLRVSSAEMLAEYNRWAGKSFELSDKTLPPLLANRGISKKYARPGRGMPPCVCYIGIALQSDPEGEGAVEGDV